jgi:hypothetical protein
VVVEGVGPAMLLLDGARRPARCCRAVGWLDERRVVYESGTARRLRLLVWNTRSGAVTRLSTFTGPPGERISSIRLPQSRS